MDSPSAARGTLNRIITHRFLLRICIHVSLKHHILINRKIREMVSLSLLGPGRMSLM